MTALTWGLIATKNRPELVRNCIRSLHEQVDGIVVVDNNDEPDTGLNDCDKVVTFHYPGYPPNISELLNHGLDEVTAHVNETRWNVALLNDDAEVPAGWVATLDGAIEASGAALAFVGRNVDKPTVWACLVRGDTGVRFDEELRWWYSDDLFVEECRRLHGGVIAVTGPMPIHHHPNHNTVTDPNLSAQAGIDAQTYSRKLRERGW